MKLSFDKECLRDMLTAIRTLKSLPARSHWTRYRGQWESQRVIRQPNHV